MSAIWGEVSFEGRIALNSMREHYDKACKIDRIEEINEENVLFGCGIQYLTDESEHERMPFYDKKRGIFFTADCVLDNREELLAELTTVNSENMILIVNKYITENAIMPDGMIMYLAYIAWGKECLHRFRGMFSIAIYDTVNNEVLLISDQTSSRCLYYYLFDGGVAFSTLIEPIKKAHLNIELNELFFKDYLLAPGLRPNVTSIDTPYKGIYNLNPGTYLVINKNGVSENIYWYPDMFRKKYHCRNAKQYGECFLKIVKQAVHRSLRTNGEIGIAQSSGLDSLTVGTLAATKLLAENKPLYTYTYIPVKNVSDKSGKYYVINEKNAVEMVAKKYPNMINHFLTNEGKDCYSEITKILEILEFPYKSFPNMPSLYEIYKNAKKDGCKVVLSGQYGNSTISYGNIDDILYDLSCKKRYVKAAFYLNNYSKHVKESRKKAAKNCHIWFKTARKQYKQYNEYTVELTELFLTEDILNEYPLQKRFNIGEIPTFGGMPITQKVFQRIILMKEALTYIGAIETKMGLTHGVLLRDPTRDVDVIEFCYSLPYHYYAYKGTPRWLIRGNMKKYIPKEILNEWLRYGVQNSDWIYRMETNKETLLKNILKDLEEFLNMRCKNGNNLLYTSWIDMKSIYKYIKDTETSENWQDYDKWISLMSILTFIKCIKCLNPTIMLERCTTNDK